MNPVRNTLAAQGQRVVSNGVRPFVVKPASQFKAKISLPGDKSIAHRAIILSSLSRAKTKISNFPLNKDCLSTISAFKRLGVRINISGNKILVSGKGLFGLKKPHGPILVKESGTTIRLLMGVLAGQSFKAKLVAGNSLSKRPMHRVTEPLRRMGAAITSRIKNSEEYLPVMVEGAELKGITYKMPVASAQVKSAILLAGLYARGETRVLEPFPSRDHTERMLRLFKADIKLKQNEIVIKGNRALVSPGKITVPGDISSASFFLVLAAVTDKSSLLIRGVSLNPSRLGIIKALKRMKADIKVSSLKSQVSRFEPAGDIIIKSSLLKGARIKRGEIPGMIDEIPVLMVAACFAEGKTVFEGVNELRVKETDRIKSMISNLKSMGARISLNKSKGMENIEIIGVNGLTGAKIRSFNDHRTAMSMIVAGLAARGTTYLDDVSCISKSFPGFLDILKGLRR